MHNVQKMALRPSGNNETPRSACVSVQSIRAFVDHLKIWWILLLQNIPITSKLPVRALGPVVQN